MLLTGRTGSRAVRGRRRSRCGESPRRAVPRTRARPGRRPRRGTRRPAAPSAAGGRRRQQVDGADRPLRQQTRRRSYRPGRFPETLMCAALVTPCAPMGRRPRSSPVASTQHDVVLVDDDAGPAGDRPVREAALARVDDDRCAGRRGAAADRHRDLVEQRIAVFATATEDRPCARSARPPMRRRAGSNPVSTRTDSDFGRRATGPGSITGAARQGSDGAGSADSAGRARPQPRIEAAIGSTDPTIDQIRHGHVRHGAVVRHGQRRRRRGLGAPDLGSAATTVL